MFKGTSEIMNLMR